MNDTTRDNDYMDLCPNMIVAGQFTQHMSAFGRSYLEDARGDIMGGSTDMGMLPSLIFLPSLTSPVILRLVCHR